VDEEPERGQGERRRGVDRTAESPRRRRPGVPRGRLAKRALRNDPVLDAAQHNFDLCSSDLGVEQPERHLTAKGAVRRALEHVISLRHS
jgi:hypothetical protein